MSKSNRSPPIESPAVKYWDLEVLDLGPNGLYLLFSLALNTYLRELTYYDTANHDL